jgi:hypothetical protein
MRKGLKKLCLRYGKSMLKGWGGGLAKVDYPNLIC